MRQCRRCGTLGSAYLCNDCTAGQHPGAYADKAYRAANRYGRCVACGWVGRCTIDHIVALSHGGRNDPSNWQLLCRPCNSRKGVTERDS